MAELRVKKSKNKGSRGKKKECMQIPPPIVKLEPLLLSAKNVALILGVSERFFHSLNSSGKIGPEPIRKFNKRTLWDRKEMETWVAAGLPNREQWLKMKKGQ